VIQSAIRWRNHVLDANRLVEETPATQVWFDLGWFELVWFYISVRFGLVWLG
jgi:hypothetical protein